jgi:8-oxo-dGTP pyrophosphatase MutT (NUDIX family)
MNDLRLASTVLLLRGDLTSLEVLLLRRHASMRTFRNLWVFPGGQVDAEDSSDQALECIPTQDRDNCVRAICAGRSAEDSISARSALGFWVAACRETYEEAGVLLVRRDDGTSPNPRQLLHWRGRQPEFHGESAEFFAALRRESLMFDVRALVCWSRWITPSRAVRRFDTLFFVAALPPGSEVHFDTNEANESRWIEPRSVRPENITADWNLAPPTVVNLMDLSSAAREHGTASTLLERERGRRIPPIQPKAALVDGETFAVFPWDTEFALLDDQSLSEPSELPPQLRSLPSRLSARSELRGGG